MNPGRAFLPSLIALVILCGCFLGTAVRGQSTYENYTFLTIAGSPSGPGWYDGVRNAARLYSPSGIARDTNGNFYIADTFNDLIRKITPDGSVTTLAGFSGISGTNDGVGAAARFNSPVSVAVDSAGNVFVADTGNDTIRKVSPAGAVTTFAGLAGVKGKQNGTGSAARFTSPRGIAIDSSNNVYVADTFNEVIRKITPAGVVTTFAGSGQVGSADNKGTAASFFAPTGLAVDSAGNLYVADTENETIRKISPAAVVTTLAGLVGSNGISDGTGTNAHFHFPEGLALDSSNNVYVADSQNNTIRLLTPAGVVTTLAGNPETTNGVDGTGTNALFSFPIGLAVDNQGNVFIGDSGNNSIREMSPGAIVTTFAGILGGTGTNDAIGTSARFNHPTDLAFDTNGNLFVVDANNATIRKMAPDGTVSTLAGKPGSTGTNDATGPDARFNVPIGLAVDNFGNVIVADQFNNAIRQVTPAGVVTTLAGVPGTSGAIDGPAGQAEFRLPACVAVDSSNNIYVGDTHNNTIRLISNGQVSTVAGTNNASGTNDGNGLAARFFDPEGVKVDANGTIHVVDNGNATIREITPAGDVTTLAGQPLVYGSADGTNNGASFNFPFGGALDGSGNLYVGDTGNNAIRKVTPAGVVTTIAGSPGFFGSADGTGSDALFSSPSGVAVDNQGNVYVADGANQCIRKGYPALPDMPIVDIIGARTNVTRTFSISNQTTTSWSWSLVRHPSGSTAQLIGTNTANPTLTPDVEDIYTVQFQGWDNSGKTTIRRITLYCDNTPPGISITNPPAGTIATNGLFTVQGTATDNLGVSNVWVQLNGGPFVRAGGTENWTNTVSLVGAFKTIVTNTIRAYAEDFAHNVSPTNKVILPYIIGDRLKVKSFGGGSIKPNLNGVLLEISNLYSMTAKAVPGSTFSNWTVSVGSNAPFVITNSTKVSFVMQSNLTLTANFNDFTPPTLLFSSPKNGQFISNAAFTVFGTAKDNNFVTNVYFQMNGGEFSLARLVMSGSLFWVTNVTLLPGTNNLAAYAVDPSGNISATNTAIVNYVVSTNLTVTVTGQGTLTPNYNGALLAIGTNYTMTAKAANGYFFSNWVDTNGNVLSTNPSLTFLMQSNTALGVNFGTNVMLRASGNYAGLFVDTNNVTATNAGFFTASVTPTLGFSAKLLLGNASFSGSGQFSSNGVYSNTISNKNAPPLNLQMQLDLTGQGFISGSVGGAGWSVPLLANQLVFNLNNAPSQQFQRFSMAIPSADNSSSQPAGYSYGAITIDNLGTVTFAGALADGNPAAQKTFISRDGQWPFFVSSDAGNGVMLGWLTFSPGQGGTLDGHVYWETQPFAAAKVYPGGFNFTNGVDVNGSFFDFFIGKPTLVLTNAGKVVLQQAGISPPITNYFNLSAKDIVTSTNGLNLSITVIDGLFKGTAFDPVNNVSIPISGVILTNSNTGFGYFTNAGQSGTVLIGQ